MSFMDTLEHIWISFYSLADFDLKFPEPIGYISSLDVTMFFAVAYMLAEAVSMIASRRD